MVRLLFINPIIFVGIQMSTENFRGFVSALKSDTKLQQTLKDRLRQENSQEAMLSVADEAGFSFAMSHVLEAGPQLSEKELEGISGGGDAVGGAGIAQNRGV